jgi:tetratricopeptide (TPR) repeat protein
MNIGSAASRIGGLIPRNLVLLSTCSFVLLSGATCIPPACAQSPTSATALSSSALSLQDLRQRVREYLASGNYDAAITILRQLLDRNPSDILDVKANLGLCYKMKRDYANAMPMLVAAGSVAGPRQAEALFWIEDCCCEQGKLDMAVGHLDRMYAEHPELRAQVLGRRLARLNDLGLYKEALADQRELLASHPGSELARIWKVTLAGLVYKVEGESPAFGAALDDAFAAAQSEPAADAAKNLWYQLGGICTSAQQWDRAVSLYRSLLQRYPEDQTANQICVGLAYKGKRDYPNALIELKKVVGVTDPFQQKDLAFFILDCLTEQSKSEEAMTYLDRLLAEHPDWKERILYRRAICRSEGLAQHREAVADLEEYLSLYPASEDAARVKMTIAEIKLYGLAQSAEARQLLNAIIAAHPDFADMIFAKHELAFCSYTEGKYAEAAPMFEDAIKSPELGNFRALCLYMAADAYARAGNADKCREAVRKMVVSYPDDPWTKLAPNTILPTLESNEVGG